MKKTFPILSIAAALMVPCALTAAPGDAKARAKQTPKEPARVPVRETAAPAAAPARDYNDLVLQLVKKMPEGGGYSAGSSATSKLVDATAVQKGKSGPATRPELAQPSYCSGATYLVFLGVVDQLIQDRKLKLSDEDRASLEVHRQLDGVGVWGRWNANGPGTGKFFHDLGLGTNHVGLDNARPGDFLKLWWNEHIGRSERGHSVIFIKRAKTPEGEDGVQIWSSNEPDGMGMKIVPEKKIIRALVSRLEHPEALAKLSTLAPKDAFLAGMLERDCAEEEYLQNIGVKGGTTAVPKIREGETKVPIVINQGDENPLPPGRDAGTPASPVPGKNEALNAIFAGSPYAGYQDRSKNGIVQLIQMRLRYEGFLSFVRDAPGLNQTASALRLWQASQGLEETGALNAPTMQKLGLENLPELKMPGTPAPAEPAPAPRPVIRKVK